MRAKEYLIYRKGILCLNSNLLLIMPFNKGGSNMS